MFPKLFFLALYFPAWVSSEISTASNQFGLRLYSELSKRVEGDFIISPFVTGTIFPLLLNAGEGKEGSQLQGKIRKIIEFPHPSSVEDLLKDYGRIVLDYQDIPSLANSSLIHVGNGSFIPKLDDLDLLGIERNATLENLEEWSGIKPADLTGNETQLLYASKSRFRARWVNPFNPEWTKPSPFYYDETHANLRETMFQIGKAPFAEIPDLEATAIALPFDFVNEEHVLIDFGENTGRFELIILLPNERMGISRLEERIKDYPFSLIVRQFYKEKSLLIYLPKFNVSSTFELKKEVFGEDFEEVSILSFGEFSVNEAGAGMGNETVKFVPDHRIRYHVGDSFRVNRPFIGVLYDQERHLVLNMFRILE